MAMEFQQLATCDHEEPEGAILQCYMANRRLLRFPRDDAPRMHRLGHLRGGCIIIEISEGGITGATSILWCEKRPLLQIDARL